jgi:hypothetical protein
MSDDSMSGISGLSSGLDSSSAITDRQTFGAQVVTATLDKLNTGTGGEKNADYDFQTKVLGGALGVGAVVNDKV